MWDHLLDLLYDGDWVPAYSNEYADEDNALEFAVICVDHDFVPGGRGTLSFRFIKEGRVLEGDVHAVLRNWKEEDIGAWYLPHVIYDRFNGGLRLRG